MDKERLNNKKSSTRLMAIDYLKAIAVILVIINHSLTNTQQLKVGGPFWISMAVPIFMIVSGFTYSMSASRHESDSFKDYFGRDILVKRISRFMIPFLIVFVLEILLKSIVPLSFQSESMKKSIPVLVSFLIGGAGPGSYYIPVLLQFVFVFPIIYSSYRKSTVKTVAMVFSIQLAFDILTNLLNIPGSIYRLLIFRYLSLIVMGIVLFFNRKELIKRIRFVAFFSIGSIIYAFIVNYTSYKPVVFTFWTKTALPMVFFAFSIVIWGMKVLEIKNTNWITGITSLMGRASFHIFLTQKLLFGFGLNKFFRTINFTTLASTIGAVILSSILGIIFYCLEGAIRRIRIDYRNKDLKRLKNY